MINGGVKIYHHQYCYHHHLNLVPHPTARLSLVQCGGRLRRTVWTSSTSWVPYTLFHMKVANRKKWSRAATAVHEPLSGSTRSSESGMVLVWALTSTGASFCLLEFPTPERKVMMKASRLTQINSRAICEFLLVCRSRDFPWKLQRM